MSLPTVTSELPGWALLVARLAIAREVDHDRLTGRRSDRLTAEHLQPRGPLLRHWPARRGLREPTGPSAQSSERTVLASCESASLESAR